MPYIPYYDRKMENYALFTGEGLRLTMFDEKDFFREGTRRICSSLDIGKSLASCLDFIRHYVPADFASLLLMNPDLGVLEIVAYAGPEIQGVFPRVITVSQDTRNRYKEWTQQSCKTSSAYIINNIEDNIVIGSILLSIGLLNSMFLVGVIQIEKQVLGFVTIGNIQQIPYTQKHADLLQELNDPFAIAFNNYLSYREISRLRDLLEDDNRYFQDELQRRTGEEIIGASFGLRQVMEMVRHVAPQSSPVLLLGETGTGKELIANTIHNLSPRRNGPLIKVNCGAIPDSLMDSELFGHEKGAFTGAIERKRGRFERAHKGTIFLDEIGELPLNAQVRLLRVLQEKDIERVGGTEPIPVDIRVITATHRNLKAMLQEKTFREDLYFRLCVFPIEIPPLRERREDIPTLVHHFVQAKVQEMGLPRIPAVSSQSFEKLMSYPWPGNVRELQNIIDRALILSDGKSLKFDIWSETSKASEPVPIDSTAKNLMNFNSAVAEHILRTLELTGGKIMGERGAAKLLNINPSTLRKKMKKLQITFDRSKIKAQRHDDSTAKGEDTPPAPENIQTLDEFVSQHISKAIEIADGKIAGMNGAADILQINPSTLRKKMIKLGIVSHKRQTGDLR